MDLSSLPPPAERRLAANEALFRTGDPVLGLVLVREGTLELRRLSPEGRLLVLHRAGPGESCAEASLFEAHHHCDAIATRPSRVAIHPAATLREAAARDPAIGWGLARHLAAGLVAARARAERLSLPRAEDRILAALSSLPPDAAGLRRPGRSWKALAAELGLTHEALYRALARLERRGVLGRAGAAVRLGPA